MAEQYTIDRIPEIRNRNVFIDANVLIFLNWATAGSEEKEVNYSSVFQRLIENGNRLFVDFLVISEVINRILRIEYKKQGAGRNFKEFRNSDEGQQTLNDIYTVINNQIEDIDIIGKSFTKDDIMSFLNIDNLDFNDKGILKICQENKFVLLTDDGDYKNSGIDILTCNTYISR